MKVWRMPIALLMMLVAASACNAVPALVPTAPVGRPEATPTVSQADTPAPPAGAPTSIKPSRLHPTRVHSTNPPLAGATETNSPEPRAAGAQTRPTPTVTPPPPNPAYPLLTVRLQAIEVSDDDGTRTVKTSPQQVKLLVDQANKTFADASVRLLYDPDADFTTIKSTLLNKMTGDTDANWKREVDFGNQVAARYPGKLVVFFRYGPEQGPTGEGFSWSDYNFVAMPGVNSTACGHQDVNEFAHEIGHYLGLSHPFAKVFASVQEAETYLASHGNDPAAFDGDGLSDTPPDPYINVPEFQCNTSVQSVTLDGKAFPLPRRNVMSYYGGNPDYDENQLTPQQSDIVRWILNLRSKNGMATPTNNGVPGATDFATLAVKEKTGIDPNVQDMSPWSIFTWGGGDKQLYCGAQLNGTIGFSISVPATGKYGLNLYAAMAPDYGKIQTLVDGNPLGTPIDLHGLLVLPTGRISIGTLDLSAGTHTLLFRVVGKNAASAGYAFGLSEFTLTPGG